MSIFNEAQRQALEQLVSPVPWDMHESENYTGLPPMQDVVSKGYLDLSTLDPKDDRIRPGKKGGFEKGVSDRIAQLIIQRGKAFVKDPENFLLKIIKTKARFNPLWQVEDNIVARLTALHHHATGGGKKREAWLAAQKDFRAAKIQWTSVKGATGAGYKIELVPSLSQIGKKHGVSLTTGI